MPSDLTCLRVFIASPGGLADERKAFRDEIAEFNDADAIPRGVLFRAVCWEDTLGGIGRPQAIINGEVRGADYLVLLLWDRWGSPPDTTPSRFTSGTEEEYHVAMECHDAQGTMRQIVILFKAVEPRQLADPSPQLEQVLQFRKDLDQRKTHLFHGFDSTDSFRKLLRRHLSAWLRDQEGRGKGLAAPAPPEAGRGPAAAPPVTRGTQAPLAAADPALAHAWQLAEEGHLTEAEVEFARIIVGPHRPQALVEYGRFLRRVGRLDQAAVMFTGAATAATEHGDQEALAAAQRNLGIVLEVRGDLAGAERMHRESLELSGRIGNLDGVARASGNLGIVLQSRGDMDGAERMYRQSLEVSTQSGRLEGMANACGNLGIVLEIRGDLAGAEEMHRKSLEINEHLARPEGIANAYGNLGNVLECRGDLDGAARMYRKSIEINERLGHLEGLARAYGNLAVVLRLGGDLDGAEQASRKALDINAGLGRPEGVANAYGNLGRVLELRGDLVGAEQMYRQSLEISERLGRPEGIANAYADLGDLLRLRGDLDGAEQLCRKSLEINERLRRADDIAGTCTSLGMVLQARGDSSGAAQMYRRSIDMAERSGSARLAGRARSLLGSLDGQGSAASTGAKDGPPAGS